MHWSPQWLRLLSVLRRWFCCCWPFCLLLLPLWESVTVLCFVVRYFKSILVLQSSWWGRESWLLCLISLPGVSWWLSGSSSRCRGAVCGLWLWYFLIILTYYFWYPSLSILLHIQCIGTYLAWSPASTQFCHQKFIFFMKWTAMYYTQRKIEGYLDLFPSLASRL